MIPARESEPLALLKAKWPHGAELWRECQAEQGGGPFLLSFSRGKDSIAAASAMMRAGFEVIPFYCERIPGISFIDESLDYYERRLFKRKIIKALHPATADNMLAGGFQPPHWLPIAEAMGESLDAFSYQDVSDVIVGDLDLHEKTWTVTGLRAADSQMRRKNIAIMGPKAPGKRTVSAIWEWNLDAVIEEIAGAGLKLPADYRIFGRTFDGLMGEFVAPLKKHFPADYVKVLELFPLVEAEVWRYEKQWGRA